MLNFPKDDMPELKVIMKNFCYQTQTPSSTSRRRKLAVRILTYFLYFKIELHNIPFCIENFIKFSGKVKRLKKSWKIFTMESIHSNRRRFWEFYGNTQPQPPPNTPPPLPATGLPRFPNKLHNFN